MAAFSGKDGTIGWSGTGTDIETNVQNWNIETNIDLADITSMGATWKSYVPGIKDWTATAECLTDDTASPNLTNLGESATISLSDGNNTFSGTAICTSMSPSADVGGAPTITYNLQGNGTLSVS